MAQAAGETMKRNSDRDYRVPGTHGDASNGRDVLNPHSPDDALILATGAAIQI
jgi:hypothetical protein